MGAQASDSSWALLIAMCLATGYFGTLFYRDIQSIPDLNLLRLIPLSTGLFYFGGATLRVFAQSAFDSPFLTFFATWRDYSVSAMSAASVLVLMCCSLTIFVSYIYRPKHLGRLYTIDGFSAALGQGQNLEYSKLLVLLGIVGYMGGYLIQTGKLSVDVAP